MNVANRKCSLETARAGRRHALSGIWKRPEMFESPSRECPFRHSRTARDSTICRLRDDRALRVAPSVTIALSRSELLRRPEAEQGAVRRRYGDPGPRLWPALIPAGQSPRYSSAVLRCRLCCPPHVNASLVSSPSMVISVRAISSYRRPHRSQLIGGVRSVESAPLVVASTMMMATVRAHALEEMKGLRIRHHPRVMFHDAHSLIQSSVDAVAVTWVGGREMIMVIESELL